MNIYNLIHFKLINFIVESLQNAYYIDIFLLMFLNLIVQF